MYVSPENRNKANLRDFCGLKEVGVVDAVQNIREKDCCLLDVAEILDSGRVGTVY